MNRLKKILALGMVAALLAACGGNDNGPGNIDPPVIDPPSESLGPFVEYPMDLNGREVNMRVLEFRNLWDYDTEDPERTPNDTLRVMQIIEQIEQEYNFTLEIWRHPASGFLNTLRDNMRAGDTPFDILEVGLGDFGVDGLWLYQLAMPVNHVEIVDVFNFEENAWPGADFSTIGTIQWAVHFRPFSAVTVVQNALIYNDNLRRELNLPDFYEMVRNNEWTWDAFATIASDINARGGGVFPVMYSASAHILPAFIASNDGRMVENTERGFVFVGYRNDNALEAMNFLQNEFSNRGFFHPTRATGTSHGAAIGPAFAAGEAVFAFSDYALLRNLRENRPGYENEYIFGLLPTPRGPRSDRYTTVLTAEVLYHVAANIRAPREIAAVLVAIANRTMQNPEHLVLHEMNYTFQTAGSADMLTIMLDNVVVDVSRVVAASRTGGDMGVTGAGNRILDPRATPIVAMQEMSGQMEYWLNTINAMIDGEFRIP